jgi:hypothetical protein
MSGLCDKITRASVFFQESPITVDQVGSRLASRRQCPIIEAKTYHFPLTTLYPRFTSNRPRFACRKAPGETLAILHPHPLTPLENHDDSDATKCPKTYHFIREILPCGPTFTLFSSSIEDPCQILQIGFPGGAHLAWLPRSAEPVPAQRGLAADVLPEQERCFPNRSGTLYHLICDGSGK